jgi:hypothetical protein
MKVDNPNAYRFIMQDEIYLLEQDKVTKPQSAAAPVTPAPVIEVKTPEVKFNYLGKNNKSFLILVNYANEEFIPAAHLTALTNILKRKELNPEDVAILNTHTCQPVTLNKLASFFKPARLLILGSSAMPDGMAALALNKAAQGHNCAVLYSFSFDDMMESTDNKKAFWEQMKNL